MKPVVQVFQEVSHSLSHTLPIIDNSNNNEANSKRKKKKKEGRNDKEDDDSQEEDGRQERVHGIEYSLGGQRERELISRRFSPPPRCRKGHI